MMGEDFYRWGFSDDLRILDFPFNNKVMVTLHKDRALELADAIDKHFRRVRPPPDWKGKWFVCIIVDGGRRFVLFDSRAKAEKGLEEMRAAFDSGKSWRGLVRGTAKVTDQPRSTVIFSRSVSEMYLWEAESR